ncbi:MAG: AsmA-like C-terminal region-containing protein, partial [Bacteroidota bacterium]
KGFDVEKTFNAFNTVQKLMPIGKFLSGKLSSQLTFTGKLGDNMMPDLNSLTGNGNLLLIEGFLKKFAPVEKLAGLLNIKELESFSLKDVKNYIEFANGKVLVKPFKVKVNTIDMEIGGMHGFDQSLDYLINMKVPRALMGEQGNAYVNNLVSQVNSKGVPVKLGDFVNLKVNMCGTITNPVLKTDLKQAAGSLADDLKQQATDFAKAKIDSTKKAVTSAVKDTIASVKKQAVQAAGDELKKQLFSKGDTTQGNTGAKNNLGESAKGLLNNLSPFGKKKKQIDSTQH